MSQAELTYFSLLKSEIGHSLAQKGKVTDPNIANWKGQDIVIFQDDLMESVNGRISEKWFYTHIKSDAKKLPRVDILNLLSQYTGYENWQDFTKKNEVAIPAQSKTLKTTVLALVVSIIILGSSIILWQNSFTPKNFKFCFIDQYRNTVITQPIEIEILQQNESSLYKEADKNGCFSYASESDHVQFVVKSSYYKTDTITRLYTGNESGEDINLKTNDYALMIHIFSKSNIKDWKSRRNQLNKMFAEDAEIYQLFDDASIGMEMFNKSEFINKLTMPTSSLKNIEIVECLFNDNRITSLRFIQTMPHSK